MSRKLRSVCLLGCLLSAGLARAEPPEVLASIAPVHSLVASVMEGIGEPELLVPSSASDHDYALRPSDVRKIAAADLVVWIGDPLESYLVKALETEDVKHLELIAAPGVEAMPVGAGQATAGEHATHEAEGHAEHADAHNHSGVDPHIWLDPVRAQKIIDIISDTLAGMDPENADDYRRNAADTVSDLKALDEEISARLRSVRGAPFITFHDGYAYFVERYGLNQVGHLSVDPDRSTGAGTIAALRETVARRGVACAFAEPQFDPSALESLAGEARFRIGKLDAIGADLKPGPALYASLIRGNADAIESCLAPKS